MRMFCPWAGRKSRQSRTPTPFFTVCLLCKSSVRRQEKLTRRYKSLVRLWVEGMIRQCKKLQKDLVLDILLFFEILFQWLCLTAFNTVQHTVQFSIRFSSAYGSVQHIHTYIYCSCCYGKFSEQNFSFSVMDEGHFSYPYRAFHLLRTSENVK